jgi:hypothetical protein
MLGGNVPHEMKAAAIDVDVLAEPPRVTVVGEIDKAVTTELRTTLVGLLSLGHGEVDVDLRRVELLDPSAREAFTDVGSRGLVIHLHNPSPAVSELLHLTS